MTTINKNHTLAALGAVSVAGLGAVAFINRKRKNKHLSGGTSDISKNIQKFIKDLICILEKYKFKMYLFKSTTCLNKEEEFFIQRAKKKNVYPNGFFDTSVVYPQLYAPLEELCFNYGNKPVDCDSFNVDVNNQWYSLMQCYSFLWYGTFDTLKMYRNRFFQYNWAQVFSKIFNVEYLVVFFITLVQPQQSEDIVPISFSVPKPKRIRIEHFKCGVQHEVNLDQIAHNQFTPQTLIHYIEQHETKTQFKPFIKKQNSCTADSNKIAPMDYDVPVYGDINPGTSTSLKLPNVRKFWPRAQADKLPTQKPQRNLNGGYTDTLKLAISLAKHDNDKSLTGKKSKAHVNRK